MKKIFLSLALIVMVLVSAPVLSLAEETQVGFQAPQIYLKDLSLTRTDFKVGDEAQGSFVIENYGTNTESDLYYKISLDGEYKDGLSKYSYDSVTVGPVFLKAQESKKIDFSYKIPDSFLNGDNLGIKVRIVTRIGLSLSFADMMIKVASGSNFASIEKATISVSNESFSIIEGPTVQKGEKVILNYTLKNASKSDISFAPTISVYEFSNPDLILKKEVGDVVIIKSNQQKDFSLELPNFDYKAGVYFGNVEFMSGLSKKAPTLPFRYIVGGDIVTIHSITSDVTSVKKGDSFSTIISYTGKPFDIREVEIGTTTTQKYVLSVEVRNEQGQIISKYIGEQDFSGVSSIILNLKADKTAKALSVSAEIKKGEEVLNSYSTQISRIEDYVASDYNNVIGFAGIIFLILAVLLILSGNKNKSKLIKYLIVVLFVCFVITSIWWGFKALSIQKAQAFQTTSYWSSDSTRRNMSISVNNITDKNPGQSFSVSGTVAFWACNNGVNSILGTVNNNGSNGRTLSGSTVGSSYYYTGHVDFNFSNFTAPSTAGNGYRINFVDIKTCPHAGADCNVHPVIRISGYQPYNVIAPIVNGQCKAAAILPHSSMPTAPLCETGTATTPTGTGPWTWNCNGSNGGTSVTCSANKIIYPVCGTAAGVASVSQPTGTNLCSIGTLGTYGSGPDNNGVDTWFWGCVGQNTTWGNDTIWCYAPKTIVTTPTSLTASCYGTPNSVVINNAATWHALASGGTGSYTYSWSSADGLIGASSSVSKIYNTTGTKTASVEVQSGTDTTSVSCGITVTSSIINRNGGWNDPACPTYCDYRGGSIPKTCDNPTQSGNGDPCDPASSRKTCPSTVACSNILDCNFIQPIPTSPIQVNTKTYWTIGETPGTVTWKVNGTGVSDIDSTTPYTLEHFFNTVGAKTVNAIVSSTTGISKMCTSTTATVVQTGGNIQEQ